jgi:hypothetical protein
VQYPKIRKQEKVEYTLEHLEKYCPGKITNEDILKPVDLFLKDGNESDITNFPLKKGMKED